MSNLSSCFLQELPFSLLFDVWSRIRSGKELPDPAAMRLEEIPGLVGKIAILDYLGPEEVVFRMVGQEIADLAESDLTGRNVLDLVFQDRRERGREFFRKVVETPCCGLVEYSAHYPSGRVEHRRSIYLPMRGEEGSMSRIVSLADEKRVIRFAGETRDNEYGRDFVDSCYVDIGFGVPFDAA